jgi:hypothetical protein
VMNLNVNLKGVSKRKLIYDDHHQDYARFGLPFRQWDLGY